LGVDLLRGEHAQFFAAVSLRSLGSGMGWWDDSVDHLGLGRRSSSLWRQPEAGRQPWTFVRRRAGRRRMVHCHRSTCPSLSTRRFGSALASHGRPPLQWFPQESYVPAHSASRGVTVPDPADDIADSRSASQIDDQIR
jgi:hypothetical protein